MSLSSGRAFLAEPQFASEPLGAGESSTTWGDYGEAATSNPLMLSLLAGLSTCLGATVAFCSDQNKLSHSHMAFSLSLAGSVMITVSVASILPECFQVEESEDKDDTEQATARYMGPLEWQFWARWIAFGIGCGLYMLLSRFAFPEPEHILSLEPSSSAEDTSSATAPRPIMSDDDCARRGLIDDTDAESRSPLLTPQNRTTVQRKLFSNSLKHSGSKFSLNDDDDTTSKTGKSSSEAKRAWRVTMLLFVSLVVHNFPEGLAVAASSLHSNKLGWTTTVAIALHNIPEGIAIAIPCLAARPDSPWLAFLLASVSGLAEPLGAAVAVFFLQGDDTGDGAGWLNNADNMKNVLAFVAGVMIMVASIELFPEARRHMTESKVPGVSGTLAGIVIMLSSDAYLDS
jgi:zinc transporter, ZIP family